MRSHYQNKLNTLRRILDLYQEKVERKNAEWERRVGVSGGHLSPSVQSLSSKPQPDPFDSCSSHWSNNAPKLSDLYFKLLEEIHQSSPALCVYCSCFLQALTAQNEQLLEEQRAERRRSKEEVLQWHREKVGKDS